MKYQGKDVVSRRMAGLTLMIALLFALFAGAPAALAWNGDLVVRKVNVGGPAADSFNFTVSKSPNQYVDVWNPSTKTFALTGAPSASGPFTEGTTQMSYANLWTGNDGTINTWVVYTVKETAKAGYKTTIGCSIYGDWNSQLGGTIPAGYGPWTYTPGVSSGDPKVDTTVRWYNNVAYTTTCTFTNTYRSRVKVIKDFDDPISTAPAVDMTVNGANVDTSTGAATFGDGDSSNFVTVDGGSDVALAEQGTETTKLADYTTVLECRKGVNGTYGDWVAVAGGPSGTLGAAEPGKDYECRFTNVRKRAKIIIKKITVPGTLPATTTFAFSGDVGAFKLGNGESAAFTVAPDKAYVVTETVTDGFTLTSVVCSDAGQAQGASTSQGGSATINVENGEEVTCTFTNTQTVLTPPPSSGTEAGGATPGVTTPVTPSQTPTRGTARAVGTNGCAAKYAIVDVRGRQIARVSFRLNGRVAKTLTQPNVSGMFRLRLLTKNLPHGPARVTAEVVFKTSSATPRKTLAFQFSRCPARTTAPRPVFTG